MSATVYRIQGQDVTLPVRVREACSIASMYWVRTAAVRRLAAMLETLRAQVGKDAVPLRF